MQYDRLKTYTLPLPVGSSSSLPASPLHAPSVQGSPDGDCEAEEPLIVGDTWTFCDTATNEPRQTVLRSGRTVRQRVRFKDFVYN